MKKVQHTALVAAAQNDATSDLVSIIVIIVVYKQTALSLRILRFRLGLVPSQHAYGMDPMSACRSGYVCCCLLFGRLQYQTTYH